MTNVTVSNVRASSTVYAKGAVDADVRIGDIDGEVTLIPNDASGDLSTWGSIDHWASGTLVPVLRAMNDDDENDAIVAIQNQARKLAR